MDANEPVRRVEVPAYTDVWMRGDRYGVVVGYVPRTRMSWVQMDKSGQRRRFMDADLKYLD
jgi:hypothetical protein